jgi:hypothetical protein
MIMKSSELAGCSNDFVVEDFRALISDFFAGEHKLVRMYRGSGAEAVCKVIFWTRCYCLTDFW